VCIIFAKAACRDPKCAQEELYRVIGCDCLLTVEEEVGLPYGRAIIQEVERCHSPF
jgi:hypothetical protein